MEKITFIESLLADYILKIESWSKEKLINELIEIKFRELESVANIDTLKKMNEKRKSKS